MRWINWDCTVWAEELCQRDVENFCNGDQFTNVDVLDARFDFI